MNDKQNKAAETMSWETFLVLYSLTHCKASFRRDRLQRGLINPPGSLTDLAFRGIKLTDPQIDAAIDFLVEHQLAKRNKAGAVQAVFPYEETHKIYKAIVCRFIPDAYKENEVA